MKVSLGTPLTLSRQTLRLSILTLSEVWSPESYILGLYHNAFEEPKISKSFSSDVSGFFIIFEPYASRWSQHKDRVIGVTSFRPQHHPTLPCQVTWYVSLLDTRSWFFALALRKLWAHLCSFLLPQAVRNNYVHFQFFLDFYVTVILYLVWLQHFFFFWQEREELI